MFNKTKNLLNEVNDLVFEKLKGRLEALGYRDFRLQENFPTLKSGYDVGGLIFYDTDSCNNDEDPMIFLNSDLSAVDKIRVLSLLLAHAASFFGKDFRVGLMVLNQGAVFLQEEESVYGEKLKAYNVPPLYKEHVNQLARSLVNGIKKEIYEGAA